LAEDDRRRAVRFREALRALLRSNHGEAPDAQALTAMAEVGAGAPLRLAPGTDGQLRLEPTTTNLDANLAELLAIVHREMLTGRWQRLKVCASDTCQWAFYDSSRNRSGSWCSMAVCGNREKVRGHRERALQESQ
ncbi:MAG TPA: CGNR zinc finger domain-containing protein, partial [Trueperaceae bacterium]|nr:CGNR zinc finger domain-containing protein [Trueperaceae bacterium]